MHRRLVTVCATVLFVASAAAADSPLQTADEFFAAWSRGDVTGAAATWEPARVERFRAVFQRETELSCVRVLKSSGRLSHITPATATVDVDASIVRTLAATGRTEREDEHHVIELRAIARDWKVVGFRRREEVLADALVPLSAEERDAQLAENPKLVTPRLVIALSRCAILLSSRQRNDDARAMHLFAWRIAEQIDSDVARSAILAAESVHRRRTSMPNDGLAVQLAEEAERLALEAGDPDAVGRARIRLARAVEGMDPARAEALVLEVVDSADTIFDVATLSIAASQLAWTNSDRLEHARGFRYALLASRYAELSGDPSARLNAAMNVAGSYMVVGDTELARVHYERAVAVGQESNAIAAQVFSLRWVAELSTDAGGPGGEPAALGQAIALSTCNGDAADAAAVPLLVLRARLATGRGDLAVAHQALFSAYGLLAQAVMDDRFHTDTMAAEADLLLAERKPAEALAVLDGAHEIIAPHPEWEYERVWSRIYARALRMLGRRDSAISVLRYGVDSMEHLRTNLPVDPRARQAFFRDSSLHDDLVDLLVEAGRNEEALVVADQRTARTLQDFLGSPGSRKGAGTPEIERAERVVVDLNRMILTARPGDRVEALREQLAAARLHLDDLRMRSAVEQEAALAKVSPVTIDLERADPRDAVVRYVVTRGGSFAFVVRNGAGGPRVTVRRLAVSEPELDRRVKAMLARIDARDVGYRELAGELHEALIEPVVADLRDAERLSIIPDGPLWGLPFQTLIDARGNDLLARFEIRYAPSVSWLLRDAGKLHRPVSILALGDPEIGAAGRATARALVPGRTLGQLPDAALEAREAARLYPRSRVLTGSAADEASLKNESSRFDVVHVAAHALIDETQPLYSSLVLASHSAEDDGLLEARELLSLDLGAELFVLSACDTAGGRSYGGEGVVGLAWALLANGVPHVVVSQWNADSRATRTLMVSFHRFLVAGDSPSAALRRAQLELRREPRYQDPLYWAPFVVLGTARDVSSPRAARSVPRPWPASSAGTKPRRAGSAPR